MTEEEKRKVSRDVKKIEKIKDAKPQLKKKTVGGKFKNLLFGVDTKSVGEYILWDIIVPPIKHAASEMLRTAVDSVKDSIENALTGGRRNSYTTYRDRDRTMIPYNSISRNKRYNSYRDIAPRSVVGPSSRMRELDDMIFKTRHKAEEVLSRMTEFIIDYDAISVAQLYEMLDIPSDEFTLEKYGWYDLRAAQVRPVPSGYLLDLPKPRPID